MTDSKYRKDIKCPDCKSILELTQNGETLSCPNPSCNRFVVFVRLHDK